MNRTNDEIIHTHIYICKHTYKKHSHTHIPYRISYIHINQIINVLFDLYYMSSCNVEQHVSILGTSPLFWLNWSAELFDMRQ